MSSLEKATCPEPIQALFLEGETCVEASLLLRRIATKPRLTTNESCRYLLAKGADKDSAGAASGNTALHFAITQKNTAMMSFLIKLNAKLDLPNKDGKTALDLALTPANPLLAKAFMTALLTRISNEIAEKYPVTTLTDLSQLIHEKLIDEKHNLEIFNESDLILKEKPTEPLFITNAFTGLLSIWIELRRADKSEGTEKLTKRYCGITSALVFVELFKILGPDFRGMSPGFTVFSPPPPNHSQGYPHAFIVLNVYGEIQENLKIICDPLRNEIYSEKADIKNYALSLIDDHAKEYPDLKCNFFYTHYPKQESTGGNSLALATPLLRAVLQSPTCTPEEYIRLLAEFKEALLTPIPKPEGRLAMSGLRSSPSETEAGAGAGSASTASDEVSAGPGV